MKQPIEEVVIQTKDAKVIVEFYQYDDKIYVVGIEKDKNYNEKMEEIMFSVFASLNLAKTSITSSFEFKNNIAKTRAKINGNHFCEKTYLPILRIAEEFLFNRKTEDMTKCQCCGETKMLLKRSGLFTYCSQACLKHMKSCRNPTVDGVIHKDRAWDICQPLLWDGDNFTIGIRHQITRERKIVKSSEVILNTNYAEFWDKK